jgi:tetratricopeptide (TPR) repeat protein
VKPVGKPISRSESNSVAKSSAHAMPAPQSQRQASVSQPYSPPPPSAKQTFQSPPGATRRGVQGNSRLQFYAIILGVGLLGYWIFSSNGNEKKKEVHLRTEGDVARAIEDSAKAVQELKKQQETTGQDSLQYLSAQEHYIKGFRDYRQGQYARSMQSFQAALSFYPNHELARKYLLQAQRKFEAQIDFNMSQGRKYYYCHGTYYS